MKPHEFIRRIDDRIMYKISEGSSLDEVIDFFQDAADRTKRQTPFIKVSLTYLVNNWDMIDPNKRMATMYVIFLNKRIKDLKWLVENRDRFANLHGEKLYKILRLKDILSNK